MSEHPSSKPKIPFRDDAIRIVAYGAPITVSILGFVFGWWERTANGG